MKKQQQTFTSNDKNSKQSRESVDTKYWN